MQLIRYGRRTSKILGGTRPSQEQAEQAACSLLASFLLARLALPCLASGNVHKLTAEPDFCAYAIQSVLWNSQPTDTVPVFVHFNNWPRISGKAASRAQPKSTYCPEASSLQTLPGVSWLATSVSTFTHRLTRFREPKRSEILQTDRPYSNLVQRVRV